MLALKSLMARHDAVPTLIFDEVDAGIGGRTATAVAQRIARLAVTEVLVVTHMAQIACVADHLHVEKVTAAGRTTSSVRTLSRDGACSGSPACWTARHRKRRCSVRKSSSRRSQSPKSRLILR